MRYLIALLAPALLSAQMLMPIVGDESYHYVDAITPGSDSTAGTLAAPWATLAHADAVLAENSPLMLKYPDGTWHAAPPVWKGIMALYPLRAGAVTTTAYDVANGNHGTYAHSGGLSSPDLTGGFIGNASFHYYFDLGAVLGIGTGPLSIVSCLRSYGLAGDSGFKVIAASGSLGSAKGYGLYTNGGKIGAQLRLDGTHIVSLDYSTAFDVQGAMHTVSLSATRNSATGLVLYTDGTSLGSTSDTTPVGSSSLTAAGVHAGLFARDQSGGASWADFQDKYLHSVAIYNRALSSIEVQTMDAWSKAEYYSRPLGAEYWALQFVDPWNTSVTPHVLRGADPSSFSEVGPMTYAAAATLGWGNPALYRQDATHWWLTHETPSDLNGKMGLAFSSDGIAYTAVGRVGAGGDPGIMGQGGWFIDSDGPHVIGFDDDCYPAQACRTMWEAHPTNSGMTAWSPRVALATGISTIQPFNPFMVKAGSTYYLFAGSDVPGSTYYDVYSAPNLTGPFTLVHSGNWTGWGTAESLAMLRLKDGRWRAYFKVLGLGGMRYSDNPDADPSTANWTAPVALTSLSAGNTISPIWYIP